MAIAVILIELAVIGFVGSKLFEEKKAHLEMRANRDAWRVSYDSMKAGYEDAVQSLQDWRQDAILVNGDLAKVRDLARPLVQEVEKEPGMSGEWRFHQVFAKLLEHPETKGIDKWKIGMGIHLALMQEKQH